MTESKPPTSSRVIRPGGIVTTPAALGHTYTPGSQFQLMPPRPKLNQVTQSCSAVTSVAHSLITSTSSTQFQVSLPLGASAKGPLTVSYMTKPNSSGAPTIRSYGGHAVVEKLTVPIISTSAETHIKTSIKGVEIQKENYGKPVSSSMAKPVPSASPTRNIVQVQNKKESEIGKPTLVGAGLRQPQKPHPQQQVAKTNPFGDTLPISRAVPANSWVIHQQDSNKPQVSNAPLSAAVRTKPPFLNMTSAATSPHDLSKKHSIPSQSKSTISITPHIPPAEAVHRNAALTVAPIPAGGKPIYQVLAPGFQTHVQGQSNAIKKAPTMIVTQPISLSNSSSTTSGFISPSSLSSGQITVMTCGAGITYVPAPTLPNGSSSSSIPIAKVYPQQQPSSRISVASTSARLTVPVISSANVASAKTPLIQVGPVKSTSTSIVMTTITQTTIMSTIPVTVSKTVANAGMGSVLCWPNFSQAVPVSTITSTPNLRPSLTLTGTASQLSLPMPGTIRQPQNVVLVDHPKTAHLQASVGSTPPVFQVADTSRSNTSHNASNQGGPTTPTMSPKPTILRRQRPDNSTAFKKLFPTNASSNFGTQRRDLHTKPLERRPVPYPLNRPKMGNNPAESKNEIPIVIQSGTTQGDKNEVKPVLENQVFGKQLTGGSTLKPLRVMNSIKSHPSPFSNSAKDGGTQSYSIRPVMDLKVKMEAEYSSSQNSYPVKSEPASASQMLQFQSMHTYAAENPQTVCNVQHRIMTQASGQHITTNTIFTKPAGHHIYHGLQGSRSKAAPVIKSAPVTATGPHPQSDMPSHQGGPGVNSFSPHRGSPYPPDRTLPCSDSIKKEQQSRIKSAPGLESVKIITDNNVTHFPNHLAASPAKAWSNANSVDPLAGLSPRKRPRKQTHIVCEDQPVVMEDEESTDDADECEDEPMLETTPQHLNISATPTTKLPGHKPTGGHRPVKIDLANKKSTKDDSLHKTSRLKSEHLPLILSAESKPPSEYTDRNGVRYVVKRKRPSVSVLNRLKPNARSIANHFLHYSDVRVKDKKITLSDLATDKGRLDGVKVARLATQLKDMVECEKDVWNRMQAVYDGLVEYKSTLIGDATFESGLASPSPGTPSSLSNSFRKATPRSSRSSSMSAINENGPMLSPSTPLDRKAHKVKDEISNIEELAQANLQRCRVVTDQLVDTKTMLLKAVDHRQLVTDILESSSNQKIPSQASINPHVLKRLPKKKTSS